MSITSNDIDSIAYIARLGLTEVQRQQALSNINEILRLLAPLHAVDTGQVAPLVHPFEAAQRLREDQVSAEDQRNTLLALAPSAEDGLFLVPKVIE
ncbi:MAG: Asp-tRNA(Asn)/Glu-tRNA(Gln) amidotransferase subunit GatC [Pseudomonadales bacterium]|jgi:aspartyl-tRNA(Asn)/glutamyl-tRNA(Gln) amidotransferase subunit C|nr:Asp-tRNA(Asn)/Glu-tRNA(Gln) amidotransferase subunit GatC [Pseudomonadales bacterium]